MTDYTKISAEVDNVSDTLWDVATNVWEFAELGYKEFKSSAYASETLEKEGFQISNRGVGGLTTSWTATYGSGSPTVGLLVEFDALPGLGNDLQPTKTPAKNGNVDGHGCGHNLICSTSIGAAIALKNYMDKGNISGTIKVIGCPAEEQLNGKNYMAACGAFDGLDVCLHNHPAMVNTVWNFQSAASIDLVVEWRGVTAHAGAAPWEGRSALHASEIFFVAANMMREQMIPTARLHYCILESSKAVNVVPDYIKVLVRYRGPSAENLLKHKQWLIDMAKGAALCTQTKETVTNLGGIYSCLPNDVLAKRMDKHMHDYFPNSWTDEEQDYAKSIQKEMGKPETGMTTSIYPIPTGVQVGGSSDVGDVSWQVPTMGCVYAVWPNGIPPHQWGCTACNGMSIGRKGSISAAKTLAATAVDIFTDPAFLQQAKDDFTAQLDKEPPYQNLCDTKESQAGTLDDQELHLYDCAIHAAMEHFGMKEDPHH